MEFISGWKPSSPDNPLIESALLFLFMFTYFHICSLVIQDISILIFSSHSGHFWTSSGLLCPVGFLQNQCYVLLQALRRDRRIAMDWHGDGGRSVSHLMQEIYKLYIYVLYTYYACIYCMYVVYVLYVIYIYIYIGDYCIFIAYISRYVVRIYYMLLPIWYLPKQLKQPVWSGGGNGTWRWNCFNVDVNRIVVRFSIFVFSNGNLIVLSVRMI